MNKKVTQEDLQDIKDLYDEHEKLEKDAKQLYNKLKDQGKDEYIDREGPNGEVQQVRVYDALEEASQLGWDSPAGEAIKDKYPELKKKYDKQKEKRNEIEEKVHGELGINPFEVTIRDIIEIAEAAVEAQE